jgi:hypothetical protein
MKFHLSLSMILEQIDSQSRTDSLLRGIDVNNPANLDAEGYPVGYGKNNQAVSLPAFLAAYSGGADNVSLGILEMYLFRTGILSTMD